MLKWILFFFFTFNLYSLEITMSGAKENFVKYSTLHLKDTTPFLCQEMKDDFHVVTKIVCAFNQKPTSEIKDLQNDFFRIENKAKNKTFFLIITPFKKMKLYPMIFDMTKDASVYQADVKLTKHWMLVGYKEKLPFIKKEQEVDTSINFPFLLSADSLPFVGGLDIKGNPVRLQRVGDVTDYLKIKKYYKDGKYELCMELIDEIMLDYPNSLFTAELLFYKIRVYTKLEDSDNVIGTSKEFLREYSSDENIPEILALIGKAYSKIGLSSDADYFFDRLFNEHGSTEYAKWGYIYKAEMLEESGGSSQAVKYYKKALNETALIEIAVMASYKLANNMLGSGDMKTASTHIMKIAKAQPEYFIEEFQKSMDMMYKFADNSSYISAATIAKCIIDATTKEHDEYERLLKDRGMWLAQASDKVVALNALNDYLNVYPDGLFEQVVSIAKDELFFDTNDGNFSVKLEAYNELIDNYMNDTIGNRAVYEKAKLLLDNKMYSNVLEMEESVLGLDAEFYEDKEDIIVNSAVGVMKIALNNNECHEVLSISNEYNITLSNEWDDGVYKCSMMGGDYLLAREVSSRNLYVKDVELRKKWLYRHLMVDFATGNYSEVISASTELVTLIEDSDTKEYKDVYRTLFDTYQRLEKETKLLSQMKEIEKVFGNDYRDIERYVAVMSMGEKIKDNTIVIKYGEKVVKIQESSSSYAQSPFVEFTLYQAYLNIGNLDKALNVIQSLDSVDLIKGTRARQKYLLGNILTKLWRSEEAFVAYKEAIEADKDSAWSGLATSALENF